MTSILNHLEGAEKFDKRWMLPLAKMPPAYFRLLGVAVTPMGNV
jgi:hypothetical protein